MATRPAWTAIAFDHSGMGDEMQGNSNSGGGERKRTVRGLSGRSRSRILNVRGDVGHSKREKRYYALGQTNGGRELFVAFTIRRSLVRVISVRDMNRKESDAYAKHEEKAGA